MIKNDNYNNNNNISILFSTYLKYYFRAVKNYL